MADEKRDWSKDPPPADLNTLDRDQLIDLDAHEKRTAKARGRRVELYRIKKELEHQLAENQASIDALEAR